MNQKFTRTTFIILLFASVNSFAQTTLQSVNIPVVGDVWSNKTIADTTLQPGPGGSPQAWNFSNYFINPTVLSQNYVTPGASPDDQLFPTSNLKVNSYFGGFDYYIKSANELQYLGSKSTNNEIIINNVQKMLSVPLSYGDSVSNIPLVGTGISSYPITGTISVKADGAGDLTLFSGAFANTLRVKTDINIDEGSGTAFVHIQKYTWYSNTFRAPVFEISILNISGAFGTVNQKFITVSTLTTDISTPELNNFNFSVNPNPVRSNKTVVTLNLNRNSEVMLKVMDITGRVWKEEKSELTIGNNQIVLDLASLPKGIYILSAVSGTTSRQQRLIVD